MATTNRQPENLIAQAIRDTLISPNEADSNFESANVVDGLYALMRAMRVLGRAIATSEDQRAGGAPITGSLADAVRESGSAIAGALDHVAEAIRAAGRTRVEQ